jgi:hypothetical protein
MTIEYDGVNTMNENTAASMDWEAHFEQATEDIMTFQWAVS